MNNFEEMVIPELITKETVLKAFELSKYFIKQAQKVKVSEKETKSIQEIITKNKDSAPRDIFFSMLKKGDKINYTKVAELLNVTRATLYNWNKEYQKV